jgi:anthranilate phosphoribosyltransferase
MELYDRRAIEVHTVAESKAMIQAVLENQPGPAHNIVALNAGAAIYVSGVAKTLRSGVEAATQVIKSGAAKQKLEEFVAFTQKLKKA